MAVEEAETRDNAGIDIAGAGESIRELLGLEVRHLLPGLEVAANHFRRGEKAQALRTYSLLVLCEPAEPRFQRGLAACALEMGEFHLASLAASALVAAAPDDPEGYLISGRAFFGLRNFDAAIPDFREAIRMAEQAGNPHAARTAETFLQRALIAQEVKGNG